MSPDGLIPALAFRVADVACAIPCAHVIETMRRLPVVALDEMPPFTAGLATIRGTVTPVIDLAAVIGRSGSGARMVTVRAGTRVVALLVDEVIGVLHFATGDFAGRPPLLAGSQPPVVHALAVKDHALHLVLDAARLVEHADAVS
jgi:chemotaxis signal transduction protein